MAIDVKRLQKRLQNDHEAAGARVYGPRSKEISRQEHPSFNLAAVAVVG
jgi:hypothetical protein